MPYTVAQAAEAVGKSKAAIFRAIRKGTLSATRDTANGMFLLDPAELHRAFPESAAVSPDSIRDTGSDVPRNGEAHARLGDALDQIQDLRRRLDQADTDRRLALDRLAAAQERITALLTDQHAAPAPSGRRWWSWR
jgi:hypothetical protein